ncbi:hypothetical protein V1525DRAFT_43204 [Lipomyces kononenkoae]|uniref:Uncharacterized protein n=1 Tax=Lipomyces kononenkoae TaxID=34357 RepID=A0ACC3SSL2_LIPKO
MCTPIAHAKLSKIVRLALRRLCSDLHPDNQEDIIDGLGELPSFLRLGSARQLTLPYSRQLDVVRLAHAHVLILICRPSLNITGNAGTLSTQLRGDINSDRRQRQQEICLDAAHSVARISGFKVYVDPTGLLRIYVICFCAVKVMFVFLAQTAEVVKKEGDLAMREKIVQHGKSIGRTERNGKRYVFALRELWRKVRKPLIKLESVEQQYAVLEKVADLTGIRSLCQYCSSTPFGADVSPSEVKLSSELLGKQVSPKESTIMLRVSGLDDNPQDNTIIVIVI